MSGATSIAEAAPADGVTDDAEARFANTITLSYTFHETALPQGHAPEETALDMKAETTEFN